MLKVWTNSLTDSTSFVTRSESRGGTLARGAVACDVLDQLDERPTGSPGMNEGDHAVCATPRFTIDQLDALLAQRCELPPNILDEQSDMVQTLPSPLQKTRHAGRWVERLDELELRVRELEERYLHPLLRNADPPDWPDIEEPRIAGQGLVEIPDHDRGVIDAQSVHGWSRRARRSSSARPASMADSAPQLREATP